MTNKIDILTGSLDDLKIKEIFDKFREIFVQDKVSVEYFVGPGIRIDDVQDEINPSGYIIQEAILKIDLTFTNYQPHTTANNKKITRTVFCIEFNRTPKSKEYKDSPWINYFSVQTNIINDHPNNKGILDSWIKLNTNNIISCIKIINDNKILPIEDSRGRDYDISSLLNGINEIHRRFMEESRIKINELDKFYQKKQENFEETEKNRELKYQEKLKDLEKSREELNKASHKSERRKLFTKITESEELLKRKNHLSRESRYTRWAIVAFFLLSSIISTIFAIRCLNYLDMAAELSKKIDWVYEYLIIKSIISSTLAIGSLFFAARWMQSFYNADVSNSEEVERFNSDMVRASWAIETILEVQEEYKKEVPEILIKGMVHGLFDQKEKNNEIDNASLALQALLAFTGSASFGPGGPRIEIGKKEAKALSEAKAGSLDGKQK